MSQQITVLVIDDEPLIARSLARMLRGAGYAVLTAGSPVEAAPLYAQADVVVTDWDMPEGGGARVIAECSKPWLVVSGNSEVVERIRSDGGTAIDKPCSAAVVIATIQAMTALLVMGLAS